MRNIITSLGEVVGLGTISVGLGMFSLPLGVVSGGLALFAVSYRVGGSQ